MSLISIEITELVKWFPKFITVQKYEAAHDPRRENLWEDPIRARVFPVTPQLADMDPPIGLVGKGEPRVVGFGLCVTCAGYIGSFFVRKISVRFGICQLGDFGMKMSRSSEQHIAFILKQAEDGTTVEEVCRKAGISIQTYYRWRSKYGGLMPSEMKRLKQLEEENVRLKRLVANLSLDKEMLQDVIKRKL